MLKPIDYPMGFFASEYFFIKSLHDKVYFWISPTAVILNFLRIIKYNLILQHVISILLVLLVSLSCYFSLDVLGYKTVAMVLLMTVSISAMLFDILPVLLACTLSAIIWNFFFIPPTFTFHIDNTEDSLMFLLYFVIASVNAALTLKIRQEEKKSREKEEKEKSIVLYNTLLNSLSHELRTPISTILGSVDTLQENKEKLSDNNQKELLHQIETASLRLNRQVENLLNMSRLETGMLKPSNAIHYTPINTHITITSDQQGNTCILNISDTGNGISEKELPFIFDKFYRLPNSKTGGSGLGLSIVKGFVEAHDGTIVLKNNSSGGLLCTVSIPAETSFLNNLNNE